jgi:glutaredoxin
MRPALPVRNGPDRAAASTRRAPGVLATAALTVLLWAPWPAWALFKVVGPDGSVTYTDRPPPPAAGRVVPLGRLAEAEPPTPPLPAELRQAVQRHPVTLFTAPDCTPCDNARRMLQQRGVPYAERLVEANEDVLALEQRVGGRTVPALTIGAQALRGFASDEWNSFLDAAGYPRESRLPRNWQPPPVAPLVPRRAAELSPAPADPPAAPLPALPPPPPPGSIRF